jgi:murein DD-endopeptidase MepM/ murein hydrolase activator NlpD
MNLARLLFPNLVGSWPEVHLDNQAKLDFPANDTVINPLLDPDYCRDWVEGLHQSLRTNFSYGGYFEDRSHLWRGSYLKKFTHLGIDFNVPSHTEVRNFTKGTVEKVIRDPDQDGGWGGCVIVKIDKFDDLRLVFAHLNYHRQNDLPKEGDVIYYGQKIGTVAPSSENGGWYPHLHVQAVRGPLPDNLDGYGDYTSEELDRYPNPLVCLYEPETGR